MMRTRVLAPMLSALLTAFLAAGCGSKTQDQSPAPAPSESPAPAPAASAPTDTAASTVLATSLYDAGPRAGTQPVDAAKAAAGEVLFKSKTCVVCHGFGKKITCPDLKGVPMQRTHDWMQHQMMHPDVMTKTDPIAHGLMATYKLQMPNLALTADQADQLIEYIKLRDKQGK